MNREEFNLIEEKLVEKMLIEIEHDFLEFKKKEFILFIEKVKND